MSTQEFGYTAAGEAYIKEGNEAINAAKKVRARFKTTAVKTGRTTADGKAVKFGPKPLEVVKSPDASKFPTRQTITHGYKEIAGGDMLLNERSVDERINKMSKEEKKAHVAELMDLLIADQNRQAAVNRAVRMKTEQANTQVS